MIRIRIPKEALKPPSTWATSSWVERLVLYGGPILIVWLCYQIYSGMATKHINPNIMETHIEERINSYDDE